VRCRWVTAPRCPRWRSSASLTPSTRGGLTWDWAGQRASPRTRRTPQEASGGGVPDENGLLIPKNSRSSTCTARRGLALQKGLLQLPGAESQNYHPSRSTTCWPLLRGTYRNADRRGSAHRPGEGADVQVWILAAAAARALRWPEPTGCGSRPTTTLARPRRAGGRRGLPGRVRAVPATWPQPYVSVSADVVVADDRGDGPVSWRPATALGPQYPHRCGAIQFPPRTRPAPTAGPTPTGTLVTTGWTPSSPVPQAGRDPAGTAPGSHRRRRADSSPPSRTTMPGPGPLLPAARRGMGTPLTSPCCPGPTVLSSVTVARPAGQRDSC